MYKVPKPQRNGLRAGNSQTVSIRWVICYDIIL